MSVRVVLNFLNQFSNTRALSLLHNRMWQSRNSEVHVHLVQYSLLVTCFVTVYNGLPRSIMCRLIFNVEALAVIRRTCLECSCSNKGLLRSIMCNSLHEKNVFRSPENGTFFFHLTRSLGRFQQRVAPFYHDLGLELVGLFGNL